MGGVCGGVVGREDKGVFWLLRRWVERGMMGLVSRWNGDGLGRAWRGGGKVGARLRGVRRRVGRGVLVMRWGICGGGVLVREGFLKEGMGVLEVLGEVQMLIEMKRGSVMNRCVYGSWEDKMADRLVQYCVLRLHSVAAFFLLDVFPGRASWHLALGILMGDLETFFVMAYGRMNGGVG